MKERPILFSAPMVRALLAGSKTQTRRVVKISHSTPGLAACLNPPVGEPRPRTAAELCPYGKLGDHLWVREAWAHDGPDLETVRSRLEDALGGGITYGPYYRATETAPETLRWRPSIHMPRWASRITLEITGVRVERLQDISRDDAKAEGCDHYDPCDHVRRTCAEIGCSGPDYRIGYRKLWEQINGPGSWDANPWVWVVEFRRIAP